MKWLITGGSGFTGRYLLPSIQERFPKDKLLVLDIKQPKFPLSPRCELKIVDLLDDTRVTKLLIKETPDRIVHLAGLIRNENPLLMIKTNVVSCGILLEAIKSNEIPIDGFLVIGSSAQYGKINPQNPPGEEEICVPNSFYGQLKLLQENLALEYLENHDLPVICVRPANIIGPNMPSSFVVPRILNQLAKTMLKNDKKAINKKIIIKLLHMKAGRDFIDVRDVVSAYIELFENYRTRGEKFNIGTNKLTLLDEVIENARQIWGIKHLEVIEEEPQKELDLHLTNSQKIRSYTSWRPKIDLKTSLKDIIDTIS